jgi:hypothetical protein
MLFIRLWALGPLLYFGNLCVVAGISKLCMPEKTLVDTVEAIDVVEHL